MNEADFAFRIRQALNEGADRVSYKATLRLARARQLAVDRARGAAALAAPATVRLPALQLASAGGSPVDAPGGSGLWSWLRGAGFAAPLLALVVGFVGIHHWHNQQFISEQADVDFAVLLDETPIAAYADKSFGAMLSRPDLVLPPSEQISIDADVAPSAAATEAADEASEEPSEAATTASPGEQK